MLTPAPDTNARLPRYRRAAQYPRIAVGHTKQLLLADLGVFHYLAARQFTLHFSPGSLTYVQDHLKQLYHAGYVRRLFLWPDTPPGSPRAVYTLDGRGYRYLKRLGKAPRGRFRAGEQGEREQAFLRHSLAVNDVLLRLLGCAGLDARVAVAALRTERELRRHPLYVRDGGRRVGVIFDAWVDLRLDGTRQLGLAVEVDRGTEERQQFQRKVRALVRAARGPYQAMFGTPALTMLVVATPGAERRDELVRWTRAALAEMGATAEADLFRFGTLAAVSQTPSAIVAAPIWYRPIEAQPVALLPPRSTAPVAVSRLVRPTAPPRQPARWDLAPALLRP